MTPVIQTLRLQTNGLHTDAAPTAVERALLRRLVMGCSLEDAASAAGLSVLEANQALRELQARFGASYLSRLLALAILRSWV